MVPWSEFPIVPSYPHYPPAMPLRVQLLGLGFGGWGSGVVWVVRVGGDDGELRPWHYIYVYIIESRLIMRVRNASCREIWCLVTSQGSGFRV